MTHHSSESEIRIPAVAGSFYPESRERLESQVIEYLNQARVTPPPEDILGIIVPHAGYVYSGKVAAYGYKLLIGRKWDTVIIVGLCHRGLRKVSVYDHGAFETPLGVVPIDIDLATQIIQEGAGFCAFIPEAHEEEHSLEVQLPFLQKTLTYFKIVPILIDDPLLSNPLADAIFKAVKASKKSVLLIASTDLTHYPAYDVARQVDKDSIDAMLSLNPDEMDKVDQSWMHKGIPNLHCTVCSAAAVKTVIYTVKQMGANMSALLKYANSGDVSIGSKSQVVGYASIALLKKELSP
jgi:AmmeMemoRadiSam system protein B